jgi:nicotinate-nucleotide adenylyltransferase
VTRRCIVILGGSFDPVHIGHVALADYFVRLLVPDELRIIPTGNPWQKGGLRATPDDRVEMARRAFDRQPVPVRIDEQEIRRPSATYTIDTLRSVRAEAGPRASIAFLLGADQLQQLDTWHDWLQLFDHAHLCVASRPGFSIDGSHLPAVVAREFRRRAATPEQIRNASHGLTYLASNLHIDVSATAIRAAMQRGERPESLKSLIPGGVLDYIEQHHLYRT